MACAGPRRLDFLSPHFLSCREWGAGTTENTNACYRIAAFALHGVLSMKGVCQCWQRNLTETESCVRCFGLFSCLSLPSPCLPYRINSVPSGWYLVAALGPVAVHVSLKTGGWAVLRRVSFSNFCTGIHKRLYFLNCKHCVFWSLGSWLNFLYYFLENFSFTTFLNRFEINSFDTANNWKTGVVHGRQREATCKSPQAGPG